MAAEVLVLWPVGLLHWCCSVMRCTATCNVRSVLGARLHLVKFRRPGRRVSGFAHGTEFQ